MILKEKRLVPMEAIKRFGDEFAIHVKKDISNRISEAIVGAIEPDKPFKVFIRTNQEEDPRIMSVNYTVMADVTEIITCKDCKHWRYDKKVAHAQYCDMWYALRSGDDFCSAAERKE